MEETTEKAKELVDKYRTHLRTADKYDYLLSSDEIHIAKQCAKIVVNEIINFINKQGLIMVAYDNGLEPLQFWQEVETEIELY